MVTQKDWAHSSDSEDEVDYDTLALMVVSSKILGSPKSSSASSSQVFIFSSLSINNLGSSGVKSIQAEIRNFVD